MSLRSTLAHTHSYTVKLDALECEVLGNSMRNVELLFTHWSMQHGPASITKDLLTQMHKCMLAGDLQAHRLVFSLFTLTFSLHILNHSLQSTPT